MGWPAGATKSIVSLISPAPREVLDPAAGEPERGLLVAVRAGCGDEIGALPGAGSADGVPVASRVAELRGRLRDGDPLLAPGDRTDGQGRDVLVRAVTAAATRHADYQLGLLRRDEGQHDEFLSFALVGLGGASRHQPRATGWMTSTGHLAWWTSRSAIPRASQAATPVPCWLQSTRRSSGSTACSIARSTPPVRRSSETEIPRSASSSRCRSTAGGTGSCEPATVTIRTGSLVAAASRSATGTAHAAVSEPSSGTTIRRKSGGARPSSPSRGRTTSTETSPVLIKPSVTLPSAVRPSRFWWECAITTQSARRSRATRTMPST